MNWLGTSSRGRSSGSRKSTLRGERPAILGELIIDCRLQTCNEVKECHKVASSLMAEVASFLPFVDVPGNRLKSNVTMETAHKILVLFEKISMMIIEYSDDTALGKS